MTCALYLPDKILSFASAPYSCQDVETCDRHAEILQLKNKINCIAIIARHVYNKFLTDLHGDNCFVFGEKTTFLYEKNNSPLRSDRRKRAFLKALK
jgi:hypothetical protein